MTSVVRVVLRRVLSVEWRCNFGDEQGIFLVHVHRGLSWCSPSLSGTQPNSRNEKPTSNPKELVEAVTAPRTARNSASVPEFVLLAVESSSLCVPRIRHPWGPLGTRSHSERYKHKHGVFLRVRPLALEAQHIVVCCHVLRLESRRARQGSHFESPSPGLVKFE